jgi:hypothetical protein
MLHQSDVSGRAFLIVLARYAMCGAAFTCLLSLLPGMARSRGAQGFTEDGPVEWFQLGTISLAAMLFVAGALRYRPCRPLLICLATLASLAAVREQNGRLHKLVPTPGWSGAAALVALLGFTLAWRRRAQLLQQVVPFARTAGFGILWVGLTMVAVFAQVIASTPFLEALMGEKYERGFSRAIEECSETFGYVLILIGAVETLLYTRRVSDQARVSSRASQLVSAS